MGEKSVILKTDFRVWKKQTVRCFRKNTPKNQTELNGIEAIYIAVIFALSFFNYPLFYFILFHLFFALDFFRYAHAYHAYR